MLCTEGRKFAGVELTELERDVAPDREPGHNAALNLSEDRVYCRVFKSDERGSLTNGSAKRIRLEFVKKGLPEDEKSLEQKNANALSPIILIM